jgi:hypothetical protein
MYKVKNKKPKKEIEEIFYTTKERKRKEDKLMNYILESWSEGIPPNTYQIRKEIKAMNDEDLKKELEFFEED